MSKIDIHAVLSEIYGHRMNLHQDLYERSNAHREEHGEENCIVYPHRPTKAPMWPLIAAMVDARRFLEVGCGLGYTAALMAEAGGANSHVDTVENVALHADLAEQELSRIGLAGRVRILRGEAKDILPSLTEPYDVVFVDAYTDEYPDWLPHLMRLTRQGGVLITANISGVVEEWANYPPDSPIRQYVTKLVHDARFKTYIIPRGDAISYRE